MRVLVTLLGKALTSPQRLLNVDAVSRNLLRRVDHLREPSSCARLHNYALLCHNGIILCIMYVCMYVCMFFFVFICIHIHTYFSAIINRNMYVCIYCICVHTHKHMYTYIYTHMYIIRCTYASYIYMYIHVFTWLYT